MQAKVIPGSQNITAIRDRFIDMIALLADRIFSRMTNLATQGIDRMILWVFFYYLNYPGFRLPNSPKYLLQWRLSDKEFRRFPDFLRRFIYKLEEAMIISLRL